MFDNVGAWFVGPEFLTALATFLSALLSLFANEAIAQIFGTAS